MKITEEQLMNGGKLEYVRSSIRLPDGTIKTGRELDDEYRAFVREQYFIRFGEYPK